MDDYTVIADDVYEATYQIYHELELGSGEDRDGIIVLLSMDNRKYAMFVYGEYAEYAFDTYGQEAGSSASLDMTTGTAASPTIWTPATNFSPRPMRASRCGSPSCPRWPCR